MYKLKEFLESISNEFKTGLSIALALLIIFSLGNIAGSVTNINATPVSSNEEVVEDAAPEAEAPATEAPETQAPVTQAPVTQAPAVDTPAAPAPDAAPEAQAPAAPSTGAPATTGEIIALFNESANKIKTTATKATRNYQNMQVTKMELPSAMKALADSLMSKFLKPDMTPLEWTGADIAEKYPVGGTDFVSKLTEADVASATCNDNGAEYEITINLNSDEDPVYKSGEGVNSVFWVVNKDDIANNVPGLESSKLVYHDCVVIAKIDKATGNMTYAKYNFNFDFDLVVKIFGNVFATINVEEEYAIAY